MNCCASGACRQGREPCPTPLVCHVPEPEPTPMFRPTFEIEGPHFPTTRRGWFRVLATAAGIAGSFYIAGTVARHFGVL
jgi:hypothetical protein